MVMAEALEQWGWKRATSESKTVAITLVISGEVRQGYWRDESCPAVSKRSESIEKWLKFRIFVPLPLISKTGFFIFCHLFPFDGQKLWWTAGMVTVCSLAGVLCGSPAFYVGHGECVSSWLAAICHPARWHLGNNYPLPSLGGGVQGM